MQQNKGIMQHIQKSRANFVHYSMRQNDAKILKIASMYGIIWVWNGKEKPLKPTGTDKRKRGERMKKRLKLKAFRALQGMSQAEFAACIGCTRARYAGIEAGRRDGSPDFWRAIQAAFDIPDSEMWGLMQRDSSEKSEKG